MEIKNLGAIIMPKSTRPDTPLVTALKQLPVGEAINVTGSKKRTLASTTSRIGKQHDMKFRLRDAEDGSVNIWRVE